MVYIPRREEIPTPIFGGTRQNKLSKAGSGKPKNIIEIIGYTYSIEQKRMTTPRDATVDDNTVTGSTVAKPAVHGPMVVL